MFTDEVNHYELKKNTLQDPYYASIYGFWNNNQNENVNNIYFEN